MTVDHSPAAADTLAELLRTLRTATNALEKVVATRLRSMPVVQWQVLAALATETQPLSMSALQNATQLTGPSLTRLIDAMVDANLVMRKIHRSDRRQVLIALTRRGAQMHSTRHKSIALLAQELSIDTASQLSAELTDLVDQLNQACSQ